MLIETVHKELMQQEKPSELVVVLLQKVRENTSIDWIILIAKRQLRRLTHHEQPFADIIFLNIYTFFTRTSAFFTYFKMQ